METYGWDVVYATTIEQVNHSLAAHADQLLPSFSHTEAEYSLSGEFGTWQIVPGGSGKLLHLEITVNSGTLTLGTANTDLAGISAVFEIALQLIPSGTSERLLRFNFRGVGQKTGGDPDQGLVTPTGSITDPDGKLGFVQKALFPAGIAQSLVAQASAISQVFATIDLVPPGADSWLAPVQADYCYAQPEDPASGYLVILTLTSDRDSSQLQRRFDPQILAGGGNAGIGISADLFLQHVIEPALPSVYGHGTGAGSFAFNAANHTINNTATFAIDKVKSGAIWYQPYIEGLSIKVADNALQTTLHGSCGLGLNITMTFMLQCTNRMTYERSTGTIAFASDPKPVIHHDQSIPWYDYFLGPLPDIIMAIIVPLIVDGIGNGLNRSAANFTLAKQPPMTVSWSGMENFSVSAAGLSGNFYLYGEQS